MITAYAPMPAQRIIAREGYPFLFICAAAALGLAAMGWFIASAVFCILFVGIALFFRNPERIIPEGDNLILSPADGRIISIDRIENATHLDGPATKISIFMSVFNVHINRMPLNAKVRKIHYHQGKFLVASLDKASEHNERNLMVLEDDCGRTLTMTQIAGLVARRIVCYAKPGDTWNAGERFGLIRFGSRVDLHISGTPLVDVKIGERVHGGSTILGRWA